MLTGKSKVQKKSKIYAGSAAGAMLWLFLTLITLIIFLVAHVLKAEYAGKVVDYRGLLAYLLGGALYGALYDFLPGKKATTKAIAFMLFITLITLLFVIPPVFPVWENKRTLFGLLLGLAASSIVMGRS
ncbi:hypothetical protein BMS3Abin16_01284 [archaeon BMS3Abin16]|nr:hypothetical protein BMS3Abin16_01284 [archaeon BMS3Abin16]